MNDLLTSFFREAQENMKLSAAERSACKDQLCVYMKKTQVEVEPLNAREFDEGRDKLEKFMVANPAIIHISIAETIYAFMHGLVWRLSAVAAVFLVMASSLTVAAQQTVPGDWLYPLKVDVYEPIKGALIFSAEAKSAWEAERSIRRLQEIEQLLSDESLSPKEWNVLHQDFIRFAEQADKQISALSLKAKNDLAAVLSADLDRYLSGHHSVMQARGKPDDSVIFQRVSVQKSSEASNGGSYRRDTVDEMMDGISGNTQESRDLAQKHVNDALRSVAQLREQLRRIETSLNGTAEEKLEKAESQLSEANELFSIGRFADAVLRAREAERTANEGQNMLQYSGTDL